ncbi:right-handed parallel beta-helix repeat-containing protein [Sphingomonas oligophenolica]|uniref:Right-handed parallel beta-helix repeat-containing protein n=1 Tax=Sphingomonas oligophenolica TaxID=301154 RepID=A0A502CR12_9SPHN|nr:right-handed parallel beta-helix repeat-containing protein [Sphingomonas oligophenolica]TPG15263.1 right-handed parallel beta-helix repeat-containing protein [Sphingomonas oligophenolica]
MRRLLLPLVMLAAPAMAANGPFTVVETGRHFGALQDAVRAIGGGTGTILIAPGTYRQCAVQQAGRVTFRAAEPGTAIFEQEVCEDKAALVLRGTASRVEGLVFRGYSVADGNGAGIRIEAGDLDVADATFLDSQEGILGNVASAQRITIDRSTFSGLGQCDQAPNCAHSVYLGNQGSVTVTHSRFERGTGGHYLKLRSPLVTITDNSFDDTAGAKTNYMIDLSEGATGLIARNTFVQGRGKENASALIVVAAEAQTYPSAGLKIVGNDARLAPGAPPKPAFVADYSHARLALGANALGAGITPFEAR